MTACKAVHGCWKLFCICPAQVQAGSSECRRCSFPVQSTMQNVWGCVHIDGRVEGKELVASVFQKLF